MTKYSSTIKLAIIVAAMMSLVGTQGVGASNLTGSSQFDPMNHLDVAAMLSPSQMNIQLAMAKGDDLAATEHKAVRFEEWPDIPGSVGDSAAIQDDGESEGGEEEGHGSEAGGGAGQGGFDRLWDVATNG